MYNAKYKQLKDLLDCVSAADIVSKIEKFRELDFKKITDKELQEGIGRTISVNIDGIEKAILFPKISIYPSGTRFYRIRKVEQSDHYLPLKAMTFENDAWNPPNDVITRMGRLNKIGESLLYTSPGNPFVAVEEMKIQDGERFCLIVYESIKETKVTMISLWEDDTNLTSEENLKMRIISNFLKDEFTREVGEGTEHLYKISEKITKNYFDLPPGIIQDAWCYPSVAAKKSVNVCFRPEMAKDILKLVGVQVCFVKKSETNYIFECQAIASGFDADKKFMYYTVDSEECRKVFPEIKI